MTRKDEFMSATSCSSERLEMRLGSGRFGRIGQTDVEIECGRDEIADIGLLSA